MASIKKNFVYNILYEILAIILPLLTSPYIARVLGADFVGIFSYTRSITQYFLIFSMLGIMVYGNREIAKVSDDKDKRSNVFWSIYALQICTHIIVMIIYAYYAFNLAEYRIVSIIHLITLATSALNISWFFFGMREFKVTVTRNMFFKLLYVSCIFIFVKNESHLNRYILIICSGNLIAQLMLWIPIFKRVNLLQFKELNVAKHIKPSLILFVPALSVSIFHSMDRIMIGAISAISQVAMYAYARTIVDIPKSFVRAFSNVMMPHITNKIANEGKEKSFKYIESTMFGMIFLISALSFGFAAISKTFPTVFWGAEFSGAHKPLLILSIALIFSIVGDVVKTQYIIPNGKDKEYTISLFIAAIINFGLNLIFIKALGAFGAAIATLITEIFITSFQTYITSKKVPVVGYILNAGIFILIGLIMFMVVYYMGMVLDATVATLLIQIACGGIIYISLSFAYLKISNNAEANKLFNTLIVMLSKLKRKKSRIK